MSGLMGRVLVAGEAEGALLRLSQPISFWGGIHPKTGAIADPRHPESGEVLAGRIVAMERVIGSCSGSSVLLELAFAGKAPAGLILTEPDAIATLGAVVAGAMDLPAIPVLLVSPGTLAALPAQIRIGRDGCISAA
jgi:predicted aconitase with swiveling domain